MLKFEPLDQLKGLFPAIRVSHEGANYSLDGFIVHNTGDDKRVSSIALTTNNVTRITATEVHHRAKGIIESDYQFGPGFGGLKRRSFTGRVTEKGQDLKIRLTDNKLNEHKFKSADIIIPNWKALLNKTGPKGCNKLLAAITPFMPKIREPEYQPGADLDPQIKKILTQMTKDLHGPMSGDTRIDVGGYEVNGCAAACTAVSMACVGGCGYMSGGLGTATGACGATCAAAHFACLSYCTAQNFPE